MFNQLMVGRGISLQIFPYGEDKWGVIELNILDSKLTLADDYMEYPGEMMMIQNLYRRRSIKMETEASDGVMTIFDNFNALEGWLKTKCNKMWPNCGYCGRRFVANEVICTGCGGPRGE